MDPTTATPAEPRPAAHPAPHVRDKHARFVRGRFVTVRSAIVRADEAKRQGRLDVLQRARQLADGRPAHSAGVLATHDSPQLDMFVLQETALRERAAQILDERLDRYARLSTGESQVLAMARLRVDVEKLAAQALARLAASEPEAAVGSAATAAFERLARLQDDLQRLEGILFAQSLLRLDPLESEALRQVCAQRFAARLPAPPRAELPVVSAPADDAETETHYPMERAR